MNEATGRTVRMLSHVVATGNAELVHRLDDVLCDIIRTHMGVNDVGAYVDSQRFSNVELLIQDELFR